MHSDHGVEVMQGGNAYSTGEAGSELIMPNRSDSVLSNAVLGKALNDGGSGSAQAVKVNISQNFNIDAGVSAETLREVLPKLAEQTKNATIGEIKVLLQQRRF